MCPLEESGIFFPFFSLEKKGRTKGKHIETQHEVEIF